MSKTTKEVKFTIIGNRDRIELIFTKHEVYFSNLNFHKIDLINLIKILSEGALEEGYLSETERKILTTISERL